MYLAANWYLFQKFQYSNGYIQIIIFQTVSCIQFQARWKQYRVGPTKIGSSAEGAGTLEGSGGMLPRENLKFSFSKIHIWRILRENEREK